MSSDQAWRIWETCAGNGATRSEFIKNGEPDEDAIESQVDYADGEGWLKDVTANELREAIRIVCAQ